MNHNELIHEFEQHKAIFNTFTAISPIWGNLLRTDPDTHQLAQYAFCAGYSLNKVSNVEFDKWMVGCEDRYSGSQMIYMDEAFNMGRGVWR